MFTSTSLSLNIVIMLRNFFLDFTGRCISCLEHISLQPGFYAAIIRQLWSGLVVYAIKMFSLPFLSSQWNTDPHLVNWGFYMTTSLGTEKIGEINLSYDHTWCIATWWLASRCPSALIGQLFSCNHVLYKSKIEDDKSKRILSEWELKQQTERSLSGCLGQLSDSNIQCHTRMGICGCDMRMYGKIL